MIALPCRSRRRRGSVLLDALLSVFVIGLGAAAFFSLFPSFTRSQRISADETKAIQMAQRMIEHLQLLKPSDLNASTLSSIHLIDPGQDEAPFTFSTVPLDEASGYSPSRMLRNGGGLMQVEDLEAGSKRVLLTISWTSASGRSRTFSTGTVLGGYR